MHSGKKWFSALWLNVMHSGKKEMNSKILPILYLSLKPWLCCCSLANARSAAIRWDEFSARIHHFSPECKNLLTRRFRSIILQSGMSPTIGRFCKDCAGLELLVLRPYLKAFSVFNVLETCRVYLQTIDLGIVKFLKKFIVRFFEKCEICWHRPNYVQKL